MEVQHTLSAPRQLTVSLSDMMRPLFAGNGKVAVPVSGSIPFASFTYVQGVPAPDGEGFSLSRLQVLDTIIGNLVQLRQRLTVENTPKNPAAMTAPQLDAAIEDLAKKLQIASTVIPPGTPTPLGKTFGMAVSQTGSAFSLTA